MAGKIKTLVRMANQIADFFAPYTETEAVTGVHDHIRAFWTPSMRKEILAYAETGGEGLRPPVMLALERLRGGPVRGEAAAPQKTGQAAGSAG